MKKARPIRSILPLALACAMGCGNSLVHAAESDTQEAAIIKTAETFIDAFQKGDAKAVAAFWAPDAIMSIPPVGSTSASSFAVKPYEITAANLFSR